MILKNLKLENIRSYTNQEINFPLSSTLLSGDIGAGKSSILLAIDFALFGLQKSSLSGNALLRNGKQKGSVELNFLVENKDIIIKRTLKRTSTGVNQDSGHVIINNDKKEMTAVELKQFILEVLNYPQDLLTKSKSLIYRYTVYTPQDEMKNILLGDKDNRLDTLRRVFGIDKYKRIAENSSLFVKALREKRREFAGMIADLEGKKEEKQRKKESLKEVTHKIKEVEKPINELTKDIERKLSDIKKIEDKIKEFNELNKQLSLLDLNTKNKFERIKEIDGNLSLLDKKIKDIEEELKKYKQDISKVDLEKLIAHKEMEIRFFEDTNQRLSNNIREFEVKIDSSTNIKNKVKDLNQCPVCLQDVSADYKNNILKEENSKVKDLEESLHIHIKQKKEVNENLKEAKESLENLKEKDRKFDIIKIRLDSIKESSERIDDILQVKEKENDEIKKLDDRKGILLERINNLKDIENEFSLQKRELDNIQLKLKEKEIELAEVYKIKDKVITDGNKTL